MQKLFGAMTLSRTSTLARYGVLSVADLASRAMTFVATLLIVRAFHDVGLGQIGVATSIIAYALIASTCGLDVYAVRTVAQAPDRARQMVGAVMITRAAFSAIAYVVLVAACTVLPQLRDIRGLILLFGLTLFTGAFSLVWVPQALHRTGALALATACTQALYLAGVTALMLWRGPMWGIPLAQVGAECCVAAGLYVWLVNAVGAPLRPVATFKWRATILQAAPIGGAALMRTIALGSDLVLLRLLFVNDASIGWYSGAWRIFGLLMGMTALYFVILFPRLSARAAQSSAALRDEARKSIAIATSVAALASFAIALLAPFILRTLFGAPFVGGANALRILAVAIVIFVASNHLRSVLVASGRQHADLWLTAAVAVIHVLSKLILIPALGINGAALGMLVGETCSLVIAWWLTRTVLFGANPTRVQAGV